MTPFVSRAAVALAGLLATVVPSLSAQETGTPRPVGTPAPDFALVGASADGVLSDSIRPTDFRGQTLVIAFFFRARSSG
jgi:hypothetical protein